MTMAKSYPNKLALLKAAISQIEIQGLFANLASIVERRSTFIASLIAREVHGFDSFAGLPEDGATVTRREHSSSRPCPVSVERTAARGMV